jgi:cysteine desulfurase
MSDDVIYLDYNASTPCDPRVVEAMLPFLTETFANPSSRNHRPGRDASIALEGARSDVARELGGRSGTEIYFTSGATEANNLALFGVAKAHTDRGRHIVTQVTEHPSVLEPLRDLQQRGWEVTEIGVDSDGRVRLDELDEVLRDDTVLVSLMIANNETGTIQPVRDAAKMAHRRGSLLHCDAAQGVGKLAIDVNDLEIDLLSFSGHKLYAPKGIGGLYIRRTKPPLRLVPSIRGGGHEGGLRSGTPNLAGAVALARALEIAGREAATEGHRLAGFRDHMENRLTREIDGCTVNGSVEHRLPGTSNLSFTGVDGNALLASLPDLAVSSGSACTSAHPEASPVLRAMGVRPRLAKASLRLSLGRFTTEIEVERATDRIVAEVTRLRSLRRRGQSK